MVAQAGIIPMWFERFLYRCVPVWAVLALTLTGLIAMIAFGNVAIHAFKGGTRAGAAGDAVLFLSQLPALAERLRNADNYLRIKPDPHPGKSGFDFDAAPGTRADAGYLLLSRYDGDRQRSVVEFWDLDAQTLVHRWLPPIDAINTAATGFASTEVDLMRDRNQKRMLIRHPSVLENGDLVIKSRTPLTRISACNDIVWINDKSLFHHALNRDRDGYFWASTKLEPATIRFVNPTEFRDDAITRISPEGEIVFQKSVAQILLDHGLSRYVYGRDQYIDNPIHLNDVQPVDTAGTIWQPGDLFLSLRNHSLILLYVPPTTGSCG